MVSYTIAENIPSTKDEKEEYLIFIFNQVSIILNYMLDGLKAFRVPNYTNNDGSTKLFDNIDSIMGVGKFILL